MSDPIRLGGMALANGVLVHGPRAWACAVRTDDGELKVVARRKRFRAAAIRSPLLRGPARGPHQEDRLTRRDQSLGAVRAEGRAGPVEVESAEEVPVEVAVLTARRLRLAWHRGASWHSGDGRVSRIPANRNLFDTGPSHLPRVLRAAGFRAATIDPDGGS